MADLSGNLATYGVRAVLEFHAGTAKSGELRVSTESGSGRILLHDGRIAYATTASGADTVEELDRLLVRYQPGASALPDGSPETLEEALEDQVTEVLSEVLGWKTGSFEFTENAASDGSAAVHLSSVEDALQRVDERMSEWVELRQLIPANDSVFALAPQLPAGKTKATFDGLTWRLVALIGDGGSVDFISGALDVSQYRAARLLADLIEAGFVRLDDEEHEVREFASAGDTPTPADDQPSPEGVDEPAGDISLLDPSVAASHDLLDDEPDQQDPLPQLQPPTDAVTFSKSDLSEEEKNDLIRNMGKGIFPA